MITRHSDMPVEIRTAMRGGPGEVHLTKLAAQLPAHTRLFNILTINPGCGIGYHVHENETELFYFMSGRAQVRDDDETYEVAPGDSMCTSSGHGHAVTNIGDEPVNIVAVIVTEA